MKRFLTEAEVITRVHARYTCRTIIGKGSPLPHMIDVSRFGHHASYARDSYRYWGFVDETGRDAFMSSYPAEAWSPE